MKNAATATAMPYSHPQPIDRQNALRQIPHLAPGAIAFAAMAGFINTVVLGFFSIPVSHMSGAVSHLGVDLASGHPRDATSSALIVVGFVVGAALAGMIVGARKLVPGRRYAIALLVESALLAVSVGLLVARQRSGLAVVAMACGLQNATTSSYCGLMLRTTHVTGIVTDIGVMLGHWLRHRRVERWKLSFLIAVFLAFGVGGWLGAWSDLRFGPQVLALPAAGCLLAAGFTWWLGQTGKFRATVPASDAPPRTASFPDR